MLGVRCVCAIGEQCVGKAHVRADERNVCLLDDVRDEGDVQKCDVCSACATVIWLRRVSRRPWGEEMSGSLRSQSGWSWREA